ncbi:hypothetical protein M378DRAFT_743882 [Amanita muscaria Koide BX008]|uniref:Uncharacterized protein n=1 Tax=Amanita muscaria (strain Koide BX008) TaxID=946122 RepID=A0A0C2X0Z8_AMAMK|nr:hypothetical protein M378DRAFT_743882 [Amanita muscaria Koide BX008]
MIFFEIPTAYCVIALFVQATLYGLYMVTFVCCARWLVFDDDGWRFRPWTQVNLPMLTATVLVFLFETTEICASAALVHEALLEQESLFVKNIVIVNTTLEIATMLIADAVMILRCWVIYAKSWRIIYPPLLLWISMVGCTISLLSLMREDMLDTLIVPVFATVLACNISNNVYVTSAIVYQIRRGSGHGKSKHLYHIIAESGMLCSLTSMVLLVSVVIEKTRKFMGLICDAINFPVTGMAFNLILIRAARHRAREAKCTHAEGTINRPCSSFS